ncbi:hypothetical protein K437DRAFT_225778 [Tilletiaria anomala UBC 951]|uniref:Alpha/beta-hydrolase n=1 Tax=Tilletiaria anomala (strain ATCC 24038 / CBS 436.72 / UBC 951) TaxID=1037660 RepID=A0A066VXD9_TILAU|nr:uncharacterized protein K437DRAFT_225778 [Tilletiaria anomala UBC 951]KDN43215.1 hypothetical protein K437DRAFT_225778 [Tilletiaria anomala UBC 951]
MRPTRSRTWLERRQSTTFAPSDAEQSPIVSDAVQGMYVQAAQLADNMTGVKGTANGNLASVPGQLIQTDGTQYTWNSNLGPVTPGANVNGSEEIGWESLPDVPGFVLNDSMKVFNKFRNESGIMPFYISVDDPATVKRFIVVLPGKPRDTWKYANYMLNARNIVVEQQFAPFNTMGLTGNNASVGIVAPAFLNMQDLSAGACKPQYLCFAASLWQEGGTNKNPKMQHELTSFDAMDAILDQLFDKSIYPSLNQVVVAGHSLGGQGVQRYAVMKKTKAYDSNVRYWIANPGSWAWLSSNRPYPNANATCAPTFDDWPYGIHGNTSKITKYARDDAVVNNGADIVARYQSRTVNYAFGLFDVGSGDTHCQAAWQGSNHLDRGSNFVMSMGNDFPGGFPKTHTADFIANVTHQDYSMYSASISLQRLFGDELNTRNPDLTNVTNPGDKPAKAPSTGQHAFATPVHEIMARSLLGGSIGVTILAFFFLPLLFQSNYDQGWEKDEYR